MCSFLPTPGHGEYSYQQSSYGEQGYERPFDESSQHYYEGGMFPKHIGSCLISIKVVNL